EIETIRRLVKQVYPAGIVSVVSDTWDFWQVVTVFCPRRSSPSHEPRAGCAGQRQHSVMCLGSKEGEIETIRRLVKQVYPAGIVSVVSDTWDFWQVVT
ncbi:hypothetical protein CTI14_61260, partial [Methylobacterium radiotolerans]